MALATTPALAAYRTAAVDNLPKERLPEAALAGVLACIGCARRAIGARALDEAHEALVAAQRVVAALRGGLDHHAGGRVADTLDQLYGYILLELGRANMDKDAARLDALVPVISPLHEAWGRAAEAVAQGGGAAR